jgi:hypothetical protein
MGSHAAESCFSLARGAKPRQVGCGWRRGELHHSSLRESVCRQCSRRHWLAAVWHVSLSYGELQLKG